MSHTLTESGVYMGAKINKSGDLIPPDDLYEACRVFGKYVKHLGGLQWDFTDVQTMPTDPAFTRLVESYLASVLQSDSPLKGWKLPETTLILPWILRMFPDIHYIYWFRDPRDCILGQHLTDDLTKFGVPHDATEDVEQQRIASWIYQYEIMKQTPAPAHRISVRFEEFVMSQPETLARLEAFLGFPLTSIEVRPEAVGRWKTSPDAASPDLFPSEVLYNGQLEAPAR